MPSLGGGIVYYFTDTPIELWLANGPFADAPTNNQALSYLTEQPEQAYYQLLSLFVNVNLKLMPISEMPYDDHKIQRLKSGGFTHALLVKTNLAQLLNLDEVTVNIQAQQVLEQYRLLNNYNSLHYVSSEYDAKHVHQVMEQASIKPDESFLALAEGRLYLFKCTLAQRSIHPTTFLNGVYEYRVNVHARVQLKAGNFIFPQPDVEDVLRVQEKLKENSSAFDQPDFDENIQPFWAKPQT